MSLSYYAEHLAWQQRVQREIVNSTKFYQYFKCRYQDSIRSTSRKLSLSSNHSGQPAPSNPNLLRDQTFHYSPIKHTIISESSPPQGVSPPKSGGFRYECLLIRRGIRSLRSSKQSLHYYGPAEVRGKYARPAVNVEKLLNGELTVKENPVLSRPVTSGSLVRKTRVDTGVQVDPPNRPETRSKTPGRRSRKSLVVEQRSRPMTAQRPRTHTESRLIGDKTELPVLPQEVVRKIEKMQGKEENTQENPPEPSQQPPVLETVPALVPEPDLTPPEDPALVDLERPPTATTWKTTSSQRRYIDELEKLLKEERKVRDI